MTVVYDRVDQWVETYMGPDKTGADYDITKEIVTEVSTMGVTYLIEFIYYLGQAWEAGESESGFNHELDMIALWLEPKSQFFVGKK